MGLEELLSALDREARSRIQQEVEAARAEAERLRESAEASLERRRSRRLAEAEAEERAAAEGAVAGARKRLRTEELEARARFVERVLGRTRERLGDAAQDETYLATLPLRLETALELLGPGRPAVVRCAPALLEAVRARLPAARDVTAAEDPSLAAGFRAATRDGSLEVDESLEGWLERLRPRLAAEILAWTAEAEG